MNFKNIIGHFKTVHTHRKWVRYYCFKAGIPLQGILHDLSKYSPTEFFESVKYYQGNRSPIDACKEQNGWSAAWLHHKGRNKHHYEYWQDNFDQGGTPLKMPYKYALEMFCDFLGAGKAYFKDDFTIEKEIEWWENKKSKPLAMHPATIKFIDFAFESLKDTQSVEQINFYYLYTYAFGVYMAEPSFKEKIDNV